MSSAGFYQKRPGASTDGRPYTSLVGRTRPRLLAVVNDFPAPSETFILRKLRGLQAAGYDVTVAADRFRPEARHEPVELAPLSPWSHPVAATSRPGAGGALTATRTLGSCILHGEARSLGLRRCALLAPLRAARPDIVHFEFSGIAVAMLDAIDHLRPARVVVSCRGAAEQIVPLRDPGRGPALRQLFAKVDLIHCVSDDIASTARSFGAPADRILVNRPAVPVADFAGLDARRAAHAGPLRVLSVGRLHWKKGLDDALRAVARAIDGGTAVEYRIAGEGPEREKLSYLRHHLGLDDHVELLGSTRHAEVVELLAWADVLLLPSLSEGISNAALEAMAAGLPVVVTDCGGMREVVADDVDGFVVAVGDVAAMAGRLGQLATDPVLRRRLGTAAARRAQLDFDISRQIATFDRAYRQILAG
jgi:colanic acid/amylovoran biosynthesis glycosyltransferase